MRINAFQHEHDRKKRIVVQGLLRMIAAAYLRREPGNLSFSRNVYGKPYVISGGSDTPFFFNISHSAEMAVIGISTREIGVDLEKAAPLKDIRRIAEAVFSPPELQIIFQSLDPSIILDRFYTGWVQKEAVSKAWGKGMHMDFRNIGVQFSDVLPFEGGNGDCNVVVCRPFQEYCACAALLPKSCGPRA